MKFYFFALAARGKGLSGSDRIFIELARRWSMKFPIEIFLWEEGFRMCQRQHLKKGRVRFHLVSLGRWQKKIFLLCYISLVIKSIFLAFRLRLENKKSEIVYSASDFWMDNLPGFILKLRFSKITWIGSWYLSAPNPLIYPQMNSLIYWLSQKVSLYLMRNYANLIFITSKPDESKFPYHKNHGRIVIVQGGVDLKLVRYWKEKFKKNPKIYDAVFQGRFHPQKGVMELVDIWQLVVRRNRLAKLIMIGDGPLIEKLRIKILKNRLQKNIILTGYKYEGEDKFRIFNRSRIVVHPALYDSGGMAAAEAMAWGLPGVSFNLSSLKTYYPKGMLKARVDDKEEFASLIIKLLNNSKLYNRVSKDAKELIDKKWEWNKRSQGILRRIIRNT